jgi:hypothetical protein
MGKSKFLVGVVISFIMVTVALEVFIKFSGSANTSIVIDDESFGRVLKPSTDFIQIKEGFRLGRVNRYGYLGPAYPPDKDTGVVRIALVGDSYVAGLHLFERNHYRRILEEGLNSISDRRVEVLNFGLPAADFETMYLYYEVFAKRFSPDFVIYVIGTSSLNRPMEHLSSRPGPQLVVHGDSVHIDYSFRSSEAFAASKRLNLVRSFGLFSLLVRAKQIASNRRIAEELFGKFYRLFNPRKPRDRSEPGGPVERARRKPINRAVVEQLGALNREGGPKSIIMARETLPETFIDFALDNDVIYFDPSAKVDSLAQTGIDPHYWAGSQRRGHWNQYAHRVIGAFLVEKMRPLIAED